MARCRPFAIPARACSKACPIPFEATRYHSLVVARDSIPECLEVTAWTESADGSIDEVMGFRHRELAVEGGSSTPSPSSPSTVTISCATSWACRAHWRPDATMTESAMSFTPQEALQRTIEHREIFHDEMMSLMRQIMRGEVSPLMTAAIITGLRVKKETIGEITAAARVMRELATPVPSADSSHFVDIVGTGGDGAGQLQYLDHGHVRGRGGRRARGQAWRAQRVVQVGQCGPA